MLAMAAQAQQARYDHLRAVSFPGLTHRAARHLEAGGQIRSIHRMHLDTVAFSFVSEGGAGKLSAGGG